MEVDTQSTTIHQENHLGGKISQNNTSLFEKNLYRINESLKYVNQYYTPNFEQPDEDLLKVIEIEELNEPVNDKIDYSLAFFNDFYKISMNEIESNRKIEVRNILSEKALSWECKRKEECNNTPKPRNEEHMKTIRKRLIIDRDYAKRSLEWNENQLQTRKLEEKIKFDQLAKNIKLNLALKVSSSLFDDLKQTLRECCDVIAPQLLQKHIQNCMVFEKDLITFRNLPQNYDEHDITALNQFVQKIKTFKEQILKSIPKKSDEAQNDIINFKFQLDDDLEVKSIDPITFSFKLDEEAVPCENDPSNFSFVIDCEKPSKTEDNEPCTSEDGYKLILDNYFVLKKHLEETEKSYFNFLHDERYKSLRFELKKSINMPVNSISSVSSWHMSDKFERLDSLLKCKSVKTGNSTISADCHENALVYCKDTLAQKIINIGEQVASVKIETAFEVSSVITELWQVHPDFGVLLYTRFKQKCPWLVPLTVAKTNGQTDEDYYKSLGYNYTNGIVESQDKYIKRMTGIIRLFASFLVTKTKSGNALGVGQAWMLIAATVNLDPQFDVTAILLHEMLMITGYYLKAAYGRQFIKMLRYIDTTYMKKIEEVTPVGCGGPVQRLKTFISKVLTDGRIEKPKGIIPCDFW